MKIYRLLLLVSCAVLVTACSSAKKQLGLGRNSPDEFSVVERAPLTLPPDYTLRPPRNGSEQRDYESAQAQAKRVVLGSNADTENIATSGSATDLLLQQAGAAKAQPNIRAAVDKETAVISTQSRSVAEKLLFFNKGDPVPPAERLDPTLESQRLNQKGITAPTPGQIRPAPAKTTTTEKAQ